MPPSLSWTDAETIAGLTVRAGGTQARTTTPPTTVPPTAAAPTRVRFKSTLAARPAERAAEPPSAPRDTIALPAPPILARTPQMSFASTHLMPLMTPLTTTLAPPLPEMPAYEEVELPALAGSSSIPTPSLTLQSSVQGTFSEKLELFLHWLMGSTGAYAAFVADEDGLALSNRHTTEDLIAVCAVLDKTVREVSHLLEEDPEGSLSFELDADNVLHVTWIVTPAGRFAVGVVLADVLERKLIHSIRKSFRALST